MAAIATEELKAKFGDGARLIPVEPRIDARGRLTPFDFADLPFPVRRAFAVSDVPAGTTRGEHAHRNGEQLLACLSGRVDVELRRDSRRHVVRLEPGSGALHLRPGTWASQRYVQPASVLLVLASTPFEPDAYETVH